MKRISKGRRNRSDLLRYSQNLLRVVVLATFLVASLLMVAVKVAASDEESGPIRQQLAQETGGYWQRIEKPIVEPVSEERITVESLSSPDMTHAYAEEVRYGVLCGTATNSLSEGSFVFQRKYFKREHCYKSDYSFTAVATWSQPPERIIPGKPLSLQANLSKATNITSSTSSWYYAGITFSISIDEPDVRCGYGGKGVCSMLASAPTPEGHVEEKEDCVLEVGAGRSAGEQIALRYCVPAGGYRYVYEWVADEEKPADPGPQPPKPADSEPDTEYQGPSISDPDSGSSGAGWVVVIGGLAVMGAAAVGFIGLAAAAAVLVSRAKKKRFEEGHQQDLQEDEIVGYILQLSTDEIRLKFNEIQSVAIECWQVTADGSYKPAPDASIQIQPPPASSFIKVWPLSGQGNLDVHIQLDGVPPDYRYQVVVYASGGGQSTSATITVLVTKLVLSLTTPDDRNILEPGEEEGLWACASLEPDPPDPDFDSDLENSKIIFEVNGPNADWVDAGQEGENEHGKWVYLLARAPSPGATLAPGNPTLLAKYQIGNTWLVEELKLELQAEYELKLELFDVPKTSDITYNSKAGEWQASALLVYWVNANEGKTPVDPGFEYGFPDPPIQVDPPVLHVKSSDGFEVHGEHQYLLKFEVDQDLEQYFGEELTDNDGMVTLAVEAIDSEGQSYTAEIDYQLRPSAIQMIYYWEDSPEARLEGEREHNGIPLKPGELLAYEKDEIGVGAFLVRADQAEDFYTAYDQRLQLRGEPQAELRGEKAGSIS
jgi:hypothetical protein